MATHDGERDDFGFRMGRRGAARRRAVPWALVWVCWLGLGGGIVFAQEQNAEADRVYAAAAAAFADGVYERAERELARFVQAYPESSRRAEAVVLRARALLEMGQVEPARQLLEEEQGRAEGLADEYLYWLGQARYRGQDYPQAVDLFGRLNRDYPESAWRLESAYGEALSLFKMRDYAGATNVLAAPEGAFQTAVATRTNADLVLRGRLLLAETFLELKQFAPARMAVTNVLGPDLSPEYAWRAQHLACRIDVADRHWESALAGTSNLVALARQTGQARLQVESIFLRVEILESLGRRDEALAALSEATAEGIPPEGRRRALLKSIELNLDAGRIEEAAAQWESFFQQYPGDAAMDVGLLTYGELRLKQALVGLASPELAEAPPAALSGQATNLLREASSYFVRLTTNYPQSQLIGQAWLNQGWCLWLEGRAGESREAFAKSLEALPFSRHRAWAHLKLADTAMLQGALTNAIPHYRAVLDEFVEMSDVRAELFDYALYQLVRAHLELDQVAQANQAMDELVKDHGASAYADQAMLLVAQALSRQGKSAASREILADCLQRYPDRGLVPEVQLALARTYVEDQNWTEAMAQYDRWIERYTNHVLRPRALFNQAWSTYRSGQETNALAYFTNFLARYPSHELSAQARLWLGDFYLSHEDNVRAQASYQDTNLLRSPLGYLARMMAGRAAFAGGRWKDAGDHFVYLLNDSQCPPSIAVEALFGYGDTIVRQVNEGQKELQKFEDAIVVFQKIPQLYPEDPRVPNAWGRIGQCYFTMGQSQPQYYQNATNAFHRVLAFSQADLSVLSQAEMGLGLVKERMAKQQQEPERTQIARQALDHYLNIIYGVRPALGEEQKPDPIWLKEAGLAAGRLAEELEAWETAEKLYQRLMSALPPLRSLLVKRLERVREQMAAKRI